MLRRIQDEQKVELVQGLVTRLEQLRHRDSEELDALRRRAEMIIRRVFGDDSKYLNDLKKIHFYPRIYPADEEYYNSAWSSGQNKILNLFNTMLEELLLFDMSARVDEVTEVNTTLSDQVFVVHGHDEAMKQDVARTLMRLDLEPLILHERPDKGRTVIEKFSEYSDVSFAVVLLSPDDLARERNEPAETLKLRARQNVIFELGFFIGKLSRERVLALYRQEENFEMPSDYSGVLYTSYDAAGSWRFKLVQELKGSGYDVDANKLI